MVDDVDVDVIVVGSGAAGLSAALAAAVAGADVAVLEAADVLGGTTSVSGGAVWIPGNHRASEAGAPDGPDEARRYCSAHGATGELVDAFRRAGPVAARFVEEHSPIRFQPMRYPDSFADDPDGRAAGRNLEVAPIAGDHGGIGWPAGYPMVLTNDELHTYRPHAGGSLPPDLFGGRMAAGEVTMGLGLVSGLVQGCRAASVRFLTGHRVRTLVRGPDGAVAGVNATTPDGDRRLGARRGVILATGGFEHDAELVRVLHERPVSPLSPPTNRGDGVRLAGSAGAQIAHGEQSWRWPALDVPGEAWDDPAGTPRPRMLFAERAMPHVIWVNRAGHRFVNEASHNAMLAFDHVDAATNRPANMPAWAVCDARFRSRYTVAGHADGQPVPDWLVTADSLADLAERAGIDADGLVDAVARFNTHVRDGADPDFGRGATTYDRFTGDPDAPHPNLGEIGQPPFFALPVSLGVVGTKGGPRTDVRGRVLTWTGEAVPGLYAAGNAAAAVIGPGTLSNGASLGVALTFGWLAGTTAAGAEPKDVD